MKVYDNMRTPLLYAPQRNDDTIEIAPRNPESQRYNPFQTPPDFEIAQNHGKAKRVYRAKAKQLSVSLVKRICPCCGLEIEGDPLPLNAKLSELYPLGSSYALYFRSVKFGIILLTLMFAISGIFNVVTNASQGDCALPEESNGSDYCIQDSIMTYTIANKRNNTHLLTIQMVLNMIIVIVIPIFFQFFYYRIRRTTIEADELTITPSDYTVKVRGITPESDDHAIQQWVEGLAGFLKCTKINRTYDISKYVDLHKQKDILTTQKSETYDDTDKLCIQHDIDQIDKELEILKHQELQRTSTVFISFQEAQQAQYLIEEYKKALVGKWCSGLTGCFSHNLQEFNGQWVSIKRAPEPTDIIWENQGFDAMEKAKRIITSEVISGVVIILCFFLVVLIGWGQNTGREKLGQNSSLIPFLSALASYLVVTVNYVLGMATRYLSGREKHETYTSYFASVARRLSASMFINTAFTTVFAKLVTLASFGEFNDFDQSPDAFNFYRNDGVLENMFYIFLSNAIVGPIYTILNPFHFLKQHKRKKALEQGKNSTMTQQKAHLIFEGIETDLSFRNAVLAKTILLTSFFAPAMPLMLLISIAGLIFSYWADKYSLLRRSALPASLDHTLTNHMIRIFEVSGFLFALGNFVFMLTLQNSDGKHDYSTVPYGLIIATLIISIVYFFVPRRRTNAKLFPLPEEAETNQTYQDARVDFPSDYDIENPMTKREGLHEYVEFLRRKTMSNPMAVSMNASMKKGGFHSMFQNNLRELVTTNIGIETAQIRKQNDLVFLDEYASRNPNASILMKRSARERTVGIDQLIKPVQNFHSGL